MQLEPRKAQDVAGEGETSAHLRVATQEVPYPTLIATWAKNRPGQMLENLMQFFSVENLRQAYHAMDPSKAVGQDGVTKETYGKRLQENLQTLHAKMRKMAYRPASARVVMIPKPDGRMRPIAISNFEDKLVQEIAANVLTAIYDRDFKRFSFGFRPKRSCHGALSYLYNKLRNYDLPRVVDVDLSNFFGSIDHKDLLSILALRIKDKTFLRYLDRMLRAGILVEGAYQDTAIGTPQGSIVSPILANVYLHHVLDQWFVKTIQPILGGEMVRYADDFVVAFASQETAREFVDKLKVRLDEFKLAINPDKTRIVCFDRNSPDSGTFDFLGFTFFWGKVGAHGKTILKLKTSMRTLTKKIQNFIHWIKAARSRLPLESLWEKVALKLQGHYAYFGVFWNRPKLFHFYSKVIWNLFRWLNRRSQKTSYSWVGFTMRLKAIPLPLPTEAETLLNLSNPRCYCV